MADETWHVVGSGEPGWSELEAPPGEHCAVVDRHDGRVLPVGGRA